MKTGGSASTPHGTHAFAQARSSGIQDHEAFSPRACRSLGGTQMLITLDCTSGLAPIPCSGTISSFPNCPFTPLPYKHASFTVWPKLASSLHRWSSSNFWCQDKRMQRRQNTKHKLTALTIWKGEYDMNVRKCHNENSYCEQFNMPIKILDK
jgi:hypothetical protein